ncbi:LacI family DNA-binding transcriptional regulator [Aeromicrobium sp. Marseille-Q0843]|uniref:LacI family DNA-binding transcriptional regulator n=1 Tax=Aeromicrobium phoceense TaxID=2754045 RepID=A0A838XDS0_9ACTN|nr:LacI family DNA-binding transcriptional regulator [Aeromicrobium phoceense]MBA4608685.1 LacI family DNA-binding transcriptional regulator [Aeromicrobium phoceense]
MTDSRQPTLEEVARLAGVGRGTASRVVNGSEHVSPHTRDAVERAVRELGYVPNQAARALRTRRTDTVALVIAEDEERVFAEPFFAGLVRGISRAVDATSRRLVLSMVPDESHLDRLGQFLTPQHVDGVMVVSMHDALSLPESPDLPIVHVGRPRDARACYVDVDNLGGARQAVDHIIGRGRQRIACITGPQDLASGRDRLDGYREALAAAGLPFEERLVEPGDFSDASGVSGAAALLERCPDLDAIFAANDVMALGALRELSRHGLRVPEDVAVVGFDGSPAAAASTPVLTTVHQPLAELGTTAVEVLAHRIDDPGAEVRSVVLPAELRAGESA